ncbi:ABC transporter substrate-binding protein [Candidatus Puniceispirillum sp.]|uniref:ABC transporter substrate-binding protein n=1 Tax=Candidatus Puniceispirillum sp. TaxID=2026719 RepID=UPI003F6A414D
MAKIHLQFTLFSAFYSPLISTMTGSFLAEEGFEYDWSVAEPGVSALNALEDGTAQVVQSTISQGFASLENGHQPKARHFALINNMDGFFISGRDNDKNFEWSSLEGADVLVHHGGQPMTMFKYACHKAGIDIHKINIIDAGNAKEMDAAYRQGQGQYIHQQGPAPQQLEADGVGYVVAALGPMVGPCAFSSLAAMPEWLETDDGHAFCRAYARTRQYVATRPAAEIAIAEKSLFPQIDEAVLTQCIHAYQNMGCWPVEMAITDAGYNAMLDIFAFDEKISQRHPYGSICMGN